MLEICPECKTPFNPAEKEEICPHELKKAAPAAEPKPAEPAAEEPAKES